MFIVVGFIQDEVFFFSLIIFTSNYLYFTERQTERQSERETETETEIERQRETEIDRDRERQRERDREIERDRERQRDRDTLHRQPGVAATHPDFWKDENLVTSFTVSGHWYLN